MQPEDFELFCEQIIEAYNATNSVNRRKIADATKENIKYWLDFHDPETILYAIKHQNSRRLNDFYRTISFDTLFRRTGRDKTPVDYIEEIYKRA